MEAKRHHHDRRIVGVATKNATYAEECTVRCGRTNGGPMARVACTSQLSPPGYTHYRFCTDAESYIDCAHKVTLLFSSGI